MDSKSYSINFLFLRLSIGFPNTYTLSKALTEDILMTYREKFPIVIIRPSMIFAAKDEPINGYVEGSNMGLVGNVAGTMCGLIRTNFVEENVLMKITPVDFVANCTIVSAYKRSITMSKDLMVFNCSDADSNQISWRDGQNIFLTQINKFPIYEKLVWYPRASVTSSMVWHKISLFLFQLVPAIFFDLVFRMIGRKPT